jgi:DNA-binding LacI/PurR family transcriptional regulator
MVQGRKRVTSADVAQASGVSRATVSYVLNNDPRQTIPVETRERVLKAAKQLGYRPYAPARTLRAGYSRIVLAVLPYEQIDPGLARRLRDLQAALAEQGFSLICHVGLHSLSDHTHPSSNLTPAVIAAFTDQEDKATTAFLGEFNAPIVWMHTPGYGEAVGAEQVTYLVSRGYERIVFAAPTRSDVQTITQSRLEGVRRRCSELGIAEPFVQVIPFSRAEAREAIENALALNRTPFGLCCYNDEVAIAAMSGLRDAGIKVPESVAVIGCDDIPLAQFSAPALTTITIASEDQKRLEALSVDNILAASRGEPLRKIPAVQLTVALRESA